MAEIKLVKKYPNIRDEDVTEIFQEGYLKGFENGRKNAIPIDKPFLKMRYGDYVVYNKKWLVDHLQTEWTILQGKEYQPSIPIEWINSYTTGLIFSDDYVDNADSIDYYIDCIDEMVRDWEKENEHKESD